MASSFLIVPQWQGSISSRAMRLADGAEAVRGDLPASSTITVPVPLGAGSDQGSGVHRLTALQQVRDASRAALKSVAGAVITIGGDCGVSLAPIQHVLAEAPGKVAVVWFDAHPDLNMAQGSPSGAFGGMVLRTLLGDGHPALVQGTALDPALLVLVGTRQSDPLEAAFIEDRSLTVLAADAHTPDALVTAIRSTGASSVYLHIDLDVLDPGELSSLSAPVPFGLTAAALIDTVRAVRAKFPLAGATIAAFEPASPDQVDDDLPTILRIIGALS